MKNNLLYIAAGIVIVCAAAFVFLSGDETIQEQTAVRDYKNTEYVIGGERVMLVDGVAEVSGEDAVGKTTTRYFGNELLKDLNDDGREDAVFLLTQDGGGSGTFFYVVAALNTEAGYVGSEAILLGDRIAPQTTESGPGKQIIVNYADRAPDEPMSTPPSVGKSVRLILDTTSMQFGEVVNDFEGEVDPSLMSLDMKTWIWQRADYANGRELIPLKPGVFSIRFTDADSFLVTTDCNGAGGTYSVESDSLLLTDTFSTMMYCEESQESDFLKLLQETSGFKFTSRGELIFILELDKGTVTFR